MQTRIIDWSKLTLQEALITFRQSFDPEKIGVYPNDFVYNDLKCRKKKSCLMLVGRSEKNQTTIYCAVSNNEDLSKIEVYEIHEVHGFCLTHFVDKSHADYEKLAAKIKKNMMKQNIIEGKEDIKNFKMERL